MMRLKRSKVVAAVALAWVVGGCDMDAGDVGQPETFEWSLPSGFPTPLVPEDNPMSDAKISLGRHLFYDLRLSGNGTLSCASCHVQEAGFADPRTKSVGATGDETGRNAPGLANSAYYSTYTWSSRLLAKFEQQMLIPMFNEDPIELGLTGNEEEVLQRFRTDAEYDAMFASAFPAEDDPVSIDNIVKAIASFMRTMIAGNTAWHRWTYQGDDDALSESAQRGAALFFSERLECHHCHGGFNLTQATIYEGSAFEEVSFHNVGLYNIDGEGAYPTTDQGLIDSSGDPNDMGRFRAPSLINVAVTAPYFHDGSAETLDDVIDMYAAGGRNTTEGPNAGDGRENPFKSGFLRGFTLTDQERLDLIAFLESLTDESFLTDAQFADPFN